MRACDVIKPEIIERLLNQLLLKQRTQKPVINAMMAADQEYRSSIKLSLIHIYIDVYHTVFSTFPGDIFYADDWNCKWK